MAAELLRFVSLPTAGLGSPLAQPGHRELPLVRSGDRLEIVVHHEGGGVESMSLPPEAADVMRGILDELARGARLAVLRDDQELTPNQAAKILGISRPLVVHRMESGDLPFRYVGTHRKCRLRDVLALQARLAEQQAALDALAADTDELRDTYGL